MLRNRRVSLASLPFYQVSETVYRHIDKYLSKPDVREQLGVDPVVPANFTSTNGRVKARFDANLDHLFPTQYHLAALLERGIRVLVYVGANDWICNWVCALGLFHRQTRLMMVAQVGNERMTLNLEWTGQGQFVKQPLKEWFVNGSAAGLTRSAKGFTFATVYGGGHLVSHSSTSIYICVC